MFHKRKNYSLEISTIIALIITLIIISAIGIIREKMNTLVNNLIMEGIVATHEVLESTINESFTQAKIYAKVIASSDKINSIIKNQDEELFYKSYDPIYKGLDFITIYDEKGNVILKTQEDNYCRDIKNCHIINHGLVDGTSIGISKCNHNNKLSIVATNSIKNEQGITIGLVSCGYDLTNPDYINKVKEKILCDITVFKDDTRISTTLKDGDNSLIGTKMDPEIAQKVIRNKESIIKEINLFNSRYIGYYSPIINEHEVVGALFVGINTDDTTKEVLTALDSVKLILIVVGILSIITVFIINILILSKPIDEFNDFIERLNTNKNIIDKKDWE